MGGSYEGMFIICFVVFTSNTFSQNVSPEFSELKGMEDQSGNTHLFYRINSATYDSISYWTNRSNNIYHFDLLNQQDTLFLESYMRFDSIYYYPEDFVIADLNFWQDNPSCYIYGGATQITILNEQTFIQRFDSENTYDKGGVVKEIEISKQNDSLLYAGVNVYDAFLELTIKSTDGGWNWESLSNSYEMLSLNPSNDQIFLAREDIFKNLYKTTDGGGTYYIVDSSMTYQEQQYHYDPDEIHIYRIIRNFFTNDYELKVSSNGGEAFSWVSKYISPDQIFISNNESIAGEIYLANGNSIYISTDYGDSFNPYKTLGRNIFGIYKKPNSDKLYAATKYKIYEITPDSIQIIKNLPIPDEVLNYYPLTIGNKWVYDEVTVVYDPYPNVYHNILVKEILGDTLAPNGKYYHKVNDETLWENSVLERVDSSEGRVYRYYEDQSLPENEYLAYDLLAEVGDTLLSFRMGFNTVMFTTMYAETTFEKWGLTNPKKVFQEYTLHPPIFSITQDVGLDSIYFYFDFGDTYITLKGCVINGIVYGDTTVVSVENETPNLPIEFSLSQNYPNPFNPSTTIRFTTSELRFTTLKVYDVLGNEIATLVNEELPAGEYEVEFNPISSNLNLVSGIYFYQLKAGSFIQTKKMVLIK
jgi:hypothetical protein